MRTPPRDRSWIWPRQRRKPARRPPHDEAPPEPAPREPEDFRPLRVLRGDWGAPYRIPAGGGYRILRRTRLPDENE